MAKGIKSIGIKTPQDVLGNGSLKSTGTFNGVDGYQKRTATPNGVDEKVFDGTPPKNNLDIKTPQAGDATIVKNSGKDGNY